MKGDKKCIPTAACAGRIPSTLCPFHAPCRKQQHDFLHTTVAINVSLISHHLSSTIATRSHDLDKTSLNDSMCPPSFQVRPSTHRSPGGEACCPLRCVQEVGPGCATSPSCLQLEVRLSCLHRGQRFASHFRNPASEILGYRELVQIDEIWPCLQMAAFGQAGAESSSEERAGIGPSIKCLPCKSTPMPHVIPDTEQQSKSTSVTQTLNTESQMLNLSSSIGQQLRKGREDSTTKDPHKKLHNSTPQRS